MMRQMDRDFRIVRHIRSVSFNRLVTGMCNAATAHAIGSAAPINNSLHNATFGRQKAGCCL